MFGMEREGVGNGSVEFIGADIEDSLAIAVAVSDTWLAVYIDVGGRVGVVRLAGGAGEGSIDLGGVGVDGPEIAGGGIDKTWLCGFGVGFVGEGAEGGQVVGDVVSFVAHAVRDEVVVHLESGVGSGFPGIFAHEYSVAGDIVDEDIVLDDGVDVGLADDGHFDKRPAGARVAVADEVVVEAAVSRGLEHDKIPEAVDVIDTVVFDDDVFGFVAFGGGVEAAAADGDGAEGGNRDITDRVSFDEGGYGAVFDHDAAGLGVVLAGQFAAIGDAVVHGIATDGPAVAAGNIDSAFAEVEDFAVFDESVFGVPEIVAAHIADDFDGVGVAVTDAAVFERDVVGADIDGIVGAEEAEAVEGEVVASGIG